MEQELDRISTLPEPILQHILSFIPFKQIAQCSLNPSNRKSRNYIILLREFYLAAIDKSYISLQTLHQQELLALVNSCIGYVIELNVKELNLYIESGYFPHYSLHQSVLVSKSITELCLYGCNLKLFNSGDINLPNLKKLVFDTILVNDQIIQNLVDSCPVVECTFIRKLHQVMKTKQQPALRSPSPRKDVCSKVYMRYKKSHVV
ncbi:hypothetical protein I3843_14G081600 [Carya illinoinensis]|nr:hypothetical protein I3843_14G081600 [Carya illinoinensis]